MRTWIPVLRLARRDALRARGRSLLVVVMIALPVMAVTAAAVLIATSLVSSQESLDRRLGTAAASVQPAGATVMQEPDPDRGMSWGDAGQGVDVRRALDEVRAVLGDREFVAWAEVGVQVTTERGRLDVTGIETDLASPLVEGRVWLEDGRWPGEGEVVVTPALVERGYDVGTEIDLDSGSSTVVGVFESASVRDAPMVAGPRGSVLPEGSVDGMQSWLVGGDPVTWDQVLRLNDQGVIILSRAVIMDPPPDEAVPYRVDSQILHDDVRAAWLSVVLLVITMALLEVVLLAGPAFAVGARRQARTLALMAANGGTPPQLRRVVLASGLVLGTAGALVGVVLGIAGARIGVPILQGRLTERLGPFEVVWWQVGVIAAFGLLSALLAAVVPAWLASRQDVVSVLAGRRDDPRPSAVSPVLGLVLVGAGIAAAVVGSRGNEVLIALAALVAVVGMILVVPLVVVLVARLAGRLPLPLRFAARDAARHRTRTVPAVAAVAATVAGVVALGIANASDQAEAEATYSPVLTRGWAAVTWFDADEASVRAALAEAGVEAQDVRGLTSYGAERWTDARAQWPGRNRTMSSAGSALGTMAVISDTWPELAVTDADRERAEAALAAGKVVQFVDEEVADTAGTLRVRVNDRPQGERTPVDLVFVQGHGSAPAALVIPTSVAERLAGAEPETTALLWKSDLTAAQEENLTEAVQGVGGNLYVEHGYQRETADLLVFVVLGAMGAALMLGGTLTATFLALSDARPDLATLSAVGAAPRTRRSIAASYALVVGLVGALLGAAVGLIPGIAITYPLTGNSWMPVDANGVALPDHFLVIPWTLVLGLVVVLPLVTAAVMGLTARSRLPLVARLD